MNRNLRAVDVCGMQGVGLTRTAAKAHAMARIAQALDGSYAPTILHFPCQISAVIYRTPTAWNYILTSRDPAHPGNCHDQGYVTESQANRACRIQAAQWLYGRTEDDGLGFLVTEEDRWRHERFIAFQRCYAFYKAQGLTDAQCRAECFQHEEEFLPTAQPGLF